MSKQYLDYLYNDANRIREDREFVAEQYNKRQKEKFKHRVADNFKISQDHIFMGVVIGLSLSFIFKVWVFWSIFSFIVGI